MSFHSEAVGDSIHVINAFTYTDSAERIAAVVTTADIGKVAKQSDNDSYYILIDTTPKWSQIDATGYDTFIELEDTMSTYIGRAGDVLLVGNTETGVTIGQAMRITDSPTFTSLNLTDSLTHNSLNNFMISSNKCVEIFTEEDIFLYSNTNGIELDAITRMHLTVTSGPLKLITQEVLAQGQMSIGSLLSPATDASIDLKASDKAFLHNRLTTTQRDALAAIEGMVIYNTTLDDIEFYDGVSWGSMAGGDVTGPTSSIDNTIARFDGISGKNIQDSNIIIDDSDNITGVTSINIRNDDTGTGLALNPVLILSNHEYTVNTGASLGFEFASGIVGAAITGLSRQSSGGGELTFMTRSSTGVKGEHMRIINTGNVGIGTTTPSQKLVVQKNQNDTTLLRVSNLTAGTASRVGLQLTTSGSENGYVFMNSASYTGTADWADSMVIGVDSTVDGGVVLHSFDKVRIQNTAGTDVLTVTGGKVGIGLTTPEDLLHLKANGGVGLKLTAGDASIAQINFGDTADTNAGRIDFNNTDNSFSFVSFNGSQDTRHMTILNSGFVGIGTNAPTTPLEVVGSARFTTSVNSPIFAGYNSSSNSNITMLGSGGVGTLAFNTSGSEAMHIDASQMVGIGTDTPEERLHVFGTNVSIMAEGDGITKAGFKIKTNNVLRWDIHCPSGQDRLAFIGTNELLTLRREGNIGIGTVTPNASSILEVTSFTKGFLMPRMSTTQRNLISTPAMGLEIFNTTTLEPEFYNGTAWQTASGGGVAGPGSVTNNSVARWDGSGGDALKDSIIFTDNFGRVGIGLPPVASAALDVSSPIRGFLMPRMSTTQRDAISSPATGLGIYNTTTQVPEYFNGTDWTSAVEIPAVILPTKEFFIPSTSFSPEGNSNDNGEWTNASMTLGGNVRFNFYVPADFSTLTDAVMIFIADATETVQFDVSTSFAAAGEAYTTHTDSIVDGTQGFTLDRVEEIDISTALKGIAARDYIGVFFESDTTSLKIIGFRFKYF